MKSKKYCRGCNLVSKTGLFVTIVVWVLLAAPMVSAFTVPFPGDGDTHIKSDGSPEVWLAYCDNAWHQCNTTHNDGDDVYVTMTIDWADDRSWPAAERRHNFTMIATYGATGCGDGTSESTYGGGGGGSDLLNCTVPDVAVYTYMYVYYNASIYDPNANQVLGWLEGTSPFYFVPKP